MALFCGSACDACHIIILVLCLDCVFKLNSDALFYFVLALCLYLLIRHKQHYLKDSCL